MTETQAKSGAAGTSTSPVDNEAADSADEGANGTNTAGGRSVVGRASVPADNPTPKFTRAPGMMPPPDAPPSDGTEPERTISVSPSFEALDKSGPTPDGSGTATSTVSTGRASVPLGARVSPTVGTPNAPFEAP